MARTLLSAATPAAVPLCAALLLVTACGGSGGSGDGGDLDAGSGSGGGGSGDALSVSYKVLAANDLGMHCVDKDFSVFSMLPPFNVVNAQVVRTDNSGRPALLDGGAVTLRYSAIADSDGSTNSRSLGKTNFWQFARQLYGADLSPGEGLKGLYMPAEAPAPEQTGFEWSSSLELFKAEGVPIVPVDDTGRVNRFPLMRVSAIDKASGATLADLDVVLPVSEETTCSDCHATGAVAAQRAGFAWSSTADTEVQSRENILLLHDSRAGTSLVASQPVLCAGCHYSAALDLAGTGPAGPQRSLPSMSAAVHAYHRDKLVDESGIAYSDEWVLQGGLPPAAEQQSCYLCHPGRETRCLRGAMADTVSCQNCHGRMAAVGGTAPLASGGSLDGSFDGQPRRPWVDLPRCQSCHTGDAVSYLTLADPSQMAIDGFRTLLAFDPADPAASPRLAAGSRFAENADELFRFSKGHGGIACEGCHNSTHAIWTQSAETHNDNVAPRQLQGHTGTLVECSTCHGEGTLTMSLGGPHGMHPVGDARWTDGGHESLAERDRQVCAGCHGADFRGSPLSRTNAVRQWRNSRTVAAGVQVGCYDCHNGPDGDD